MGTYRKPDKPPPDLLEALAKSLRDRISPEVLRRAEYERLAEVERLREERDSALSRAEMSGEQTVAYEAEVERLKSGQPWEELFRQRDDAIAERDRLRVAGALHYAEVQRLREDVIGPLRAERDRLRAQLERQAELVEAACAWSEAGTWTPEHSPDFEAMDGHYQRMIAAVDRLGDEHG